MEAWVLRHFRTGRKDNVNHSQPCTETTPESDSLVRNAELHRGYGTILLVEDESFLREVTCEILESAGYRVLKARTAAEAISAFDEYKTHSAIAADGCRSSGTKWPRPCDRSEDRLPKAENHIHLRLSRKCCHQTGPPGRWNVLFAETILSPISNPKSAASPRATGDDKYQRARRLL
jgi:CheY-like chemotaxis protein